MPKLEPAGVTQKISLSQIIETGNVRKEYQDIEELAQSIKDSGLMQPIVVKRAGVTDTGTQQYELDTAAKELLNIFVQKATISI